MTFWQHRLRKQRLGLWSTLFVFLLQSLAWSGMPVYAKDVDQDWVVVCTSEGIKRISLSASGVLVNDASQNEPVPTVIAHCDLCVFAKGLGMAFDTVQAQPGQAHVPTLRIHVPDRVVPDKPYRPQQPRAPPVLSVI